MATDGPDPAPCDPLLFKEGIVIGIYGTNGANAFEEKIKRVRALSGRAVDWHYAAGRAHVKVFKEDVDLVLPILEEVVGPSGISCRSFKLPATKTLLQDLRDEIFMDWEAECSSTIPLTEEWMKQVWERENIKRLLGELKTADPRAYDKNFELLREYAYALTQN